MAFVFTAISKKKVAFECNAIQVDGLAPQSQSLLTDPLSAVLIGGALPAAVTCTTALCRTHLRVNIEEATSATPAEAIWEYSAIVEAVGAVPMLTCNMFKGAGDTGIVRGTIERVYSPAL